MRIIRTVSLFGVAAGLLSVPSFATPINPGETVAAAPVTVTQVGTALASSSGTFHAATFNATYTESVIHDSSNPFNASCGGAGCLTFVFQVTNLPGSQNGMEHVTDGDGGSGFLNYSLNVGYVPGANVAPTEITDTNYGTVSFDFPGPGVLRAGEGTDSLVVQTSAANFEPGLFSGIDSSTATVDGYVPLQTGVTPEPASVALLGTGLLGLFAVGRRRGSLVA